MSSNKSKMRLSFENGAVGKIIQMRFGTVGQAPTLVFQYFTRPKLTNISCCRIMGLALVPLKEENPYRFCVTDELQKDLNASGIYEWVQPALTFSFHTKNAINKGRTIFLIARSWVANISPTTTGRTLPRQISKACHEKP